MFFARIFRTIAIAALAAQPIGLSAALGDDDLPSSSTVNDYYMGNRAPLLSSGMIKLPPGYIRPQGWLLKQLELQTAGFVGKMEAISQWCDFKKSAWASPGGEGQFGGEELPYWLKGYTDLAFILDDPRMIANAKKWIDAILSSQGEDGYFGPRENARKPDLWPNMVALYALRSYHEATGDPRIIPFMTKYFNWVNALPRQQLLGDERQRLKGGDQLDSIYWLYNRTGERWLLELAAKNHERTADWSGSIPTMHGASLAQGFREPAQFHQQSHKPEDLQASARTYNSIMRKYGQVPRAECSERMRMPAKALADLASARRHARSWN